MTSNPSSFALSGTPIENQRPLKVRVIGAGYSGIYLGIRIPQRLRNVDLAIYEKNEAVGGTWFENRYPGCACDIPCESCNAYLTMETILHVWLLFTICILTMRSAFVSIHLCAKSQMERILCSCIGNLRLSH